MTVEGNQIGIGRQNRRGYHKDHCHLGVDDAGRRLLLDEFGVSICSAICCWVAVSGCSWEAMQARSAVRARPFKPLEAIGFRGLASGVFLLVFFLLVLLFLLVIDFLLLFPFTR